MNKQITVILLTLAAAFAAQAESTPSTGAPASTPVTTTIAPAPAGLPGNFATDHGKHMDKVAKELGLTEEQSAKMKAIIEEKHQKINAIHDETRAKLQAVLTPEQFSKFDSMHPHRHHP